VDYDDGLCVGELHDQLRGALGDGAAALDDDRPRHER
jgi:hypothetical protein